MGGQGGLFKNLSPKRSVEWLHSAMFLLVTSLCLAFSDADIEFDQCIQSTLEGQL